MLKKHFWLSSMLKIVFAASYFCVNWYILFFSIHRWTESSKEQHLCEIKIFCNYVFTVISDQFNAFTWTWTSWKMDLKMDTAEPGGRTEHFVWKKPKTKTENKYYQVGVTPNSRRFDRRSLIRLPISQSNIRGCYDHAILAKWGCSNLWFHIKLQFSPNKLIYSLLK